MVSDVDRYTVPVNKTLFTDYRSISILKKRGKTHYTQCKREFFKNYKSQKWYTLRQQFEEKCSKAKENYYQNMVEDLKDSMVF
jgi:hypothetical protein